VQAMGDMRVLTMELVSGESIWINGANVERIEHHEDADKCRVFFVSGAELALKGDPASAVRRLRGDTD
jgi:hypothetical protein